MKDGSIYTGYVSHQSFSEGTIKIDARVILKNLPSESVSIETCEDNKPRTELSKSMRTWLDARTWLIPAKDSVVTVAGIKDKISGTTYENAVILSKGGNRQICGDKQRRDCSKEQRHSCDHKDETPSKCALRNTRSV